MIEYIDRLLTQTEVNEFRNFYKKFGDDLSMNIHMSDKLERGHNGCGDRSTHLNNKKFAQLFFPIRTVIDKLQERYGKFDVWEESIRYHFYPFPAHTDYVQTTLQPYKQILIPLWWDEDFNPATYFFSSPPQWGEKLYNDCLDDLPRYKSNKQINLSIKEVQKWKQPGDAIVWDMFEYHCSNDNDKNEYSTEKHYKEFISLKTNLTN
jgi:hypothetical protein